MSGGKVALVTGASRGIGAAAAVALARGGFHVVLIARTVGGLEETDDAVRSAGGTATLLPLDLVADGAQLDLLAPTLYERFGRLDALVHAAGTLGKLTPAPHILPKDLDGCIAVNFQAAWRLMRNCGPLLLAAEAGRAVFVTDGLVEHPRAFWGLYGATKAAMQHLVLSWAAETVTTRCRVNLFDPGPVATRLRREAMPGEDAAGLPTPALVAPAVAALCGPSETRHGQIIQAGGAPRR